MKKALMLMMCVSSSYAMNQNSFENSWKAKNNVTTFENRQQVISAEQQNLLLMIGHFARCHTNYPYEDKAKAFRTGRYCNNIPKHQKVPKQTHKPGTGR